jgi:VanZ family protein
MWPAFAWSLIVLVLTLIPGEAVPDVGIFQIDKVVHFFIFGLLMILTCYGLHKVSALKGFPSNPLLTAGIYSIFFGMMIEIIQRYVPGRNFSIVDVIANTIGVGIGYLIFNFLKKRKVFQ